MKSQQRGTLLPGLGPPTFPLTPHPRLPCAQAPTWAFLRVFGGNPDGGRNREKEPDRTQAVR